MLSLTRSLARNHVSDDSRRQIRMISNSQHRWSLSKATIDYCLLEFLRFLGYIVLVLYCTTYLVLGRAPCFQGPRAEMLLWPTFTIIFALLIFRYTMAPFSCADKPAEKHCFADLLWEKHCFGWKNKLKVRIISRMNMTYILSARILELTNDL
jgi:hypothetical protein